MRDNLFDNYITQKIKDHSSAVPDDMWQRILDAKEPKRRFVFAWWQLTIAGSLMLVAILSGLQMKYNFFDINYVPQVKNSHQVFQEKKLDNKNDQQNKKQPIVVFDKIAQNNAIIFTKTKSADLIKLANSNRVNGNINNIDTKLTTNSVDKSHFFNNPHFSKKPQRTINDLNNISKNADLVNDNTKENVFAFRLKYPWQKNWNSSDKSNQFIKFNRLAIKSAKELYLPTIECPKAGDPSLRDFNIEIYASPDLVMKNTTTNKPVSDYYLAKKDSSESKLASFTVGIRISKAIGENMVFKTGVQYSQANTKFSYRTENERKQTTVITSRVIVRSPGDTIIVRDTSITEQIGYSVNTSYNKLSSIDIPILLGYEWSFNDWKIGLNAGPIINISSWQKGETLDTSFQPINFSKSKATIFKKNMGLGLYGGLSIIKNIGANTSIFAEPYFRYNLFSITNSSSLINEKYKVAGVLLGVRYNLSKTKATH